MFFHMPCPRVVIMGDVTAGLTHSSALPTAEGGQQDEDEELELEEADECEQDPDAGQ
jgi:hypothetical protein